MKRLSWVFFLAFFFWTTFQVTAQESHAKVLATKIKIYVENNIDITRQYPAYDRIRSRISDIISDLNEEQQEKKQFLKDVLFFHNNNILELVDFITSREGAKIRFKQWREDAIIELRQEIDKIKDNFNIPEGVIVLNNSYKIILAEDFHKYHFQEKQKIALSEIQTYFREGREVFFMPNQGYFIAGTAYKERKKPFYEILAEWPKKFLLYSSAFFEEAGSYYTYQYDTYYEIGSTYGVYLSEFEEFWYSYDDAVFLRLQDAKNTVTFSPRKIKMVGSDIFPSITKTQEEFLNMTVRDVLLFPEKDYSQTYKDIISTTEQVTQWLEWDIQKIRAIYDWMNKNITYPEIYEVADQSLNSAFETFQTGQGLCVWQARLMYYMLKIAWVQKVNFTDGYVIDSKDFPSVGHAWIQIGDYFYDPSFEPKYQEQSQDYLYFKVPYDITYSNRYNLRDIPDSVFEQTWEFHKKNILERRMSLTNKYSHEDGYRVLEEAFFRKKYNLSQDTISLEKLFGIIPSQKVFLKEWYIDSNYHSSEKFDYYRVNSRDEDIGDLLQQNRFQIENFTLLVFIENQREIYYGLMDNS